MDFATVTDSLIIYSMSREDRTSARAALIRYIPRIERGSGSDQPRENFEHTLTLAVSRSGLDKTLTLIQLGIVATALLLLILTIPLVLLVVRRGLAPLDRFSFKVRQLQTDQLSHRFPTHEQPAELKPLVKSFNQLLERMEAAYNRERRFTADAAHELRTPIAELRTLAEVALNDAFVATNEDVRAYFEDAEAIAKQLEMTVSVLLAMARMQQHEITIVMTQVDLSALTRAVWDRLQGQANQRNLKLDLQVGDGICVSSSSSQLESLLQNLISNSVLHSPDGATVRCWVDSDPNVTSWTIENPAPDLDITEIEHMNEPFWRKETSRSEFHLGMGLTLAQNYAALLGIEMVSALTESGWYQVRLLIPSDSAIH